MREIAMQMRTWTVLVLLWGATSAYAQNVQLITPDEAKLPNATAQIPTRGITRGPGIKLVSPDPSAKAIKGPFDLKVAFEPRGGAKIDPAGTTITYMKNPPVDLTERVKAGIKPEGIDVGKAVVPPGEHQIRITVKDDEGRQTSQVISLNVVN
jgi:hypothetical protein